MSLAFSPVSGAPALELPLLPATLSRVLRICGSDDYDVAALSEVLHRDAPLAGQFMAAAGRATSATRGRLVTLKQALVRLGRDETRRVALGVACKTRVFVLPGLEAKARVLLDHAFATALFAEEVARLRRCNVEEAFLVGLLHDIGKPAVLEAAFAARAAGALTASDEELEDMARLKHEEVGAQIAHRWELPERIVSFIGEHHASVDGLPPGASTTLRAVIQLADCLAHEKDGADVLSAHPAAALLNFYPVDIERLLAMRPRIAAEVGARA